MEDKVLQNYFPAVKFICMAAIACYIVFQGQTDYWLRSWQVCLLALILLLSVAYEYGGRYRWGYLCLEVILLGISSRFVPGDFFLLLPFPIMDGAAFFKGRWYFFLTPGAMVFWVTEGEPYTYLLICLFGAMLYMQHHVFLAHYQSRLERYEQVEYVLKDTIDSNESKVKAKLRENGLRYEKKMLEERARLSQALHDKLGHSINGSIYQLEACKILLDRATQETKEMEKSRNMLQNVIDSLRVSMDEIRSILRREKPDRKQTALVQLNELKDECRDRYNIHMELIFQGDTGRIGDPQWEVILDNTFEAVTNALKYAGCTKIEVTVLILNKVLRCCISDNGEGCKNLVTGMGLEGMKKRVRALNGTMDIDTSEGFSVNMLLPNEESDGQDG